MKRILLIRHCKSSWKHNVDDCYRPLNSRGYQQGNAFEWPWMPQVVFCSPAVRAYSTAFMALPKSKLSRLTILKELYPGDPDWLMHWMKGLSDDLKDIALVGHNPGLEELAYCLADFDGDLKTANALSIQCNVNSWSKLKDNYPAELYSTGI